MLALANSKAEKRCDLKSSISGEGLSIRDDGLHLLQRTKRRCFLCIKLANSPDIQAPAVAVFRPPLSRGRGCLAKHRQLRIIGFARLLPEELDEFAAFHRGAIGTIGRQSVIAIHQGKDSRTDRNLLAL